MFIVFFIVLSAIVFAKAERIIIKPKTSEKAQQILNSFEKAKSLKKAGIVVIEVPDEEYERVIKRLNSDPYIEYAVRDIIVKAQNQDICPSNPWWNSMVNIANASCGTNLTPTVVAVIDTGVAYDHPDLQGKLWRNPGEICGNGEDDDGNGFVDDCMGYDFVNKDHDPYDDNGHGTHIAGIIAAVRGNGDNVDGMNPAARIMSVKVLNSQGMGYVSDLVEGIYYAVDNGAKVINLSLGALLEFTCEDVDKLLRPLKDAFVYAESKGVLIISAAGNEGMNIDNKLYIPAYIQTDNHIVVGSVMDINGNRADYSNFGVRTVHVGAPGGIAPTGNTPTAICSLLPGIDGGDMYGYMYGTSIAAPFVSGVASLIYSCNLETNYRRVKARILMSSWSTRNTYNLKGIFMTEGVIDASYAVKPLFDEPTVFYVNPYKLSPGSYLEIRGVNFGNSQGSVIVGNDQLIIVDWTEAYIKAQVPQNINISQNVVSKSLKVDVNGIQSNEYIVELVKSNVPPSVKLCADKLSGAAPLEVTLRVFANDPDGNVVKYIWNISKPYELKQHTLNERVIVFKEPGSYVVEITVIDNKGASATDKIGITVTYGSGFSDDSKRACFIATAVYGEDSYFVEILRKFRDIYLINNEFGKKLVEIYYSISPPIAEILKNNIVLKILSYILLMPLVLFSWILLNFSKLYIFTYLTLTGLFLFYFLSNEKK